MTEIYDEAECGSISLHPPRQEGTVREANGGGFPPTSFSTWRLNIGDLTMLRMVPLLWGRMKKKSGQIRPALAAIGAWPSAAPDVALHDMRSISGRFVWPSLKRPSTRDLGAEGDDRALHRAVSRTLMSRASTVQLRAASSSPASNWNSAASPPSSSKQISTRSVAGARIPGRPQSDRKHEPARHSPAGGEPRDGPPTETG